MIRSCSCGRYKVSIRFFPKGTPGVLSCPTCKTSPYFREDGPTHERNALLWLVTRVRSLLGRLT